MRHNPASGAIVIMLRSLKMHGMAQAVGELTEQGAPAFGAAIPILSQLLKAETAEREVRSTAYQPQLGKQFWQSIEILEGVNQPRLLPVTQEWQIDAQAFFFKSSLAFFKRSCSSCNWRTSRWRASSCRSSSSRSGAGGEALRRFMDEGAS